MENYILTAKDKLFKYWNGLCNYDLFIENTDSIVRRLNLFHGDTGSSEYFDYLKSIQNKFALCFRTMPPVVFIPEENLLKILCNTNESLDHILENYKMILRHEYGHCLFYQELIDKYPDKDELICAYEENLKNNNSYLEKHNKLQFFSTYDASKEYYSSVPNEICANKLASVSLDDIVFAEECLRKYFL